MTLSLPSCPSRNPCSSQVGEFHRFFLVTIKPTRLKVLKCVGAIHLLHIFLITMTLELRNSIKFTGARSNSVLLWDEVIEPTKTAKQWLGQLTDKLRNYVGSRVRILSHWTTKTTKQWLGHLTRALIWLFALSIDAFYIWEYQFIIIMVISHLQK
jgi:hypothetical protein